MDSTLHSVSEEWLLKSLVKTENNDLIERQFREKSVNYPHWKQADFLKYLLLTGNEIDLKKVLCLHLFAITVPPKACKRSEDNQKLVEFTTYSFALPNFFLHDSNEEEFYCQCWYSENKEKLGKLRPCKIHLAVNVAVVEIIETVLDVLNNSNKSALKKLMTMSHDLSSIKACLSDKFYLDYIADLRNYGIFNDILKLRTEACTIIKATPKLIEISHIRKNMVLSLRVPDLIKSPNDWFLTSTANKNLLNSLESELRKINSVKNTNKEEENKENVEKTSDIKKFSKKVPFYNSLSIKRWPFTENELNIKKELERIKRINEKYLKKYDMNSSDNSESQDQNKLSNSCSFDKKDATNEKKYPNTSNDAVQKDSKSKIFGLSKQSVEKKSRNSSHQNHKDPSLETLLLENKSAQSRENFWVKNCTKQNGNKLNKGDGTDIIISDINKLVLQPIDRNYLKAGLLKVELHSKLQKLISSIDSVGVENKV